MIFIADVHLGKLAKRMRMLGFDVLYDNSFTNKQLAQIAKSENRILLSRNSAFENNKALQSFIVHSEDPATQLREVLMHFSLKEQIHPFTKCIVCNGKLNIVTKDVIVDQLQPNTRQYFNEFWQCSNCNRIYWKGSHYERMKKMIESLH